MTRFVVCLSCNHVRALADMRDKLRCKFCPVQPVAIRPGEDAVEAQLRRLQSKPVVKEPEPEVVCFCGVRMEFDAPVWFHDGYCAETGEDGGFSVDVKDLAEFRIAVAAAKRISRNLRRAMYQ